MAGRPLPGAQAATNNSQEESGTVEGKIVELEQCSCLYPGHECVSTRYLPRASLQLRLSSVVCDLIYYSFIFECWVLVVVQLRWRGQGMYPLELEMNLREV